jgi:sulfatase modifying factor 1
MIRYRTQLCCGLLLALTLLASAQEVPYYRTSHALLIGINQYQHVPALSYATADVRELREVLVRHYGFPEANITTLLDGQATKEAIGTALAAVTSAEKVSAEDRVLIFFSGHGQTVKIPTGGEKGFLIPVEAKVDLSGTNAQAYLASCIPMNLVWDALELCPAKHVLLIADACYSGLLARSRGLADAPPDVSVRVLAARTARQVLTAGRAGEKAMEKSEWGHGAFTYKLLSELKARAAEPGRVVTARELHATLCRSVTNLTGGRQTPMLADKDTEGEFLFIVPGTPGAPPPPLPEVPARPDGPGVAKIRPDTQPSPPPAPLRLPADPGRKLQEAVNPCDGATLVWIPAGVFKMGSPTDDTEAAPAEKPQHPVYLDGFFIYKTEVTVAQYRRFCEVTGRAMPKAPAWGWQDTHPMVSVTWEDAAAYARWAHAVLPTEAEWEKVARGGDGRRYPWGTQWPPQAGAGNYADAAFQGKYDDMPVIEGYRDEFTTTAPVGSFPANPYGLHDLGGNVYEWCADWYDPDAQYYEQSPGRNPAGPSSGVARVLRGGSWTNANPQYMRTSARIWLNPAMKAENFGFRCVVRLLAP